MNLSIALDGPAGSGKSTIAKLLAQRLNIMYINTGAMYRAITLIAMRNNINHNDKKNLQKLAESLVMHFDNDKLIVNDEDITDKISMPIISKNVSVYSAIPEIRMFWLDYREK